MHKLAYLILAAVIASAVGGCSESPESKAAGQILEQVDVARRHYVRAAGLLSILPAQEADPDGGPAAPESIAAAAAALREAETVLVEALRAAEDATEAGRLPANALLGQVRLAIADGHNLTAGWRSARTSDLLAQIDREATRIRKLAIADEAMAELAARIAGAEEASALAVAESLRSRAHDARETAAEQVEQLAAARAEVQAHVAAAITETDTARREAAELRRRNRTAMGFQKLELDDQASAAEAVVEAGEAKIDALQLEIERITKRLEGVQAELAAAEMELAGLTDFITGLRERSEGAGQYRATLAAGIEEVRAEVADLAAELSAEVAAAAAAFRQGLDACELAADANGRAIRAMDWRRRAAQERQAEAPNSPMGPLLETMARRSEAAGLEARKGDIAYTSAELARQWIALQQRVKRVADRAADICRSANVAVPDALEGAVAAAGDTAPLAARADSDYETAFGAFVTVADQLLTGAPVDTRPTKWLYQTAQARTLLGRYRLMALTGRADEGRPLLRQAGELAASLLEGHWGDPAYVPVKQIVEAIQEEIAYAQAS